MNVQKIKNSVLIATVFRPMFGAHVVVSDLSVEYSLNSFTKSVVMWDPYNISELFYVCCQKTISVNLCK